MCDADRILIEITHEGVMVARTLEFASEDPQEANLVKCSFTVHKSGIYTISIMVGGRHIKDSPFTKVFLPGEFPFWSWSLYNMKESKYSIYTVLVSYPDVSMLMTFTPVGDSSIDDFEQDLQPVRHECIFWTWLRCL